MIVRPHRKASPYFVSTMIEHMEFCGQISRSFNHRFEPVSDPERSMRSTTTIVAGPITTGMQVSLRIRACPI